MRILYLSLSYVPSRRASSVQVMKMCAALGRMGHDVVLAAKAGPSVPGSGAGDDFAFYGVERTFELVKLPRPPVRGGAVMYAAAMARLIAARRRRVDLVYGRDAIGCAVASWLALPLVFEAHEAPQTRIQRRLWRQMTRARRFVATVAISNALRVDLEAEGFLDGHPCIVAHDAGDPPSRAPLVRASGPNGDWRPRIGYVGSLYRGRGIELLFELARQMPGCQFDVVGGAERDLARWRAASPPENLVFHGFHPPSRLNEFYAQFDVVLLPHSRQGVLGASGASDISRWTSPMKLFEYMRSGVPLVASELPVLQEVLRHGHNALIARSDDAADWAEKIETLLGDPELRLRLARTAQEDLLQSYTWDARARLVMDQLPGMPGASRSYRQAGP